LSGQAEAEQGDEADEGLLVRDATGRCCGKDPWRTMAGPEKQSLPNEHGVHGIAAKGDLVERRIRAEGQIQQ
jgi:hypothetical protein